MRIIKKDFVNETTESYCGKGRKLSSGTAYYMQAEDGKVYYGGRSCALKHADNDLKDVPDLTKSLIALDTGNGSSGGGGSSTTEEQKKALAIAYLLLREDLLSDFKLDRRSLSLKSLAAYYKSYRETGDLSDSEVTHILNIENYSTTKVSPRLSLKNLSTCHAYNFILGRTESHLKKRDNKKGVDFVTSLKRILKSDCYLGQGRTDGLKRLLQVLPADLKNAQLKNFE